MVHMQDGNTYVETSVCEHSAIGTRHDKDDTIWQYYQMENEY